MAGSLTQAKVDALKPTGKPYWIKDDVENLRLHVSAIGTVTYQFRRGGKTITLGKADKLSLEHARRMALTGETAAAINVGERTLEEWLTLYLADIAHLRSRKLRGASLRMMLAPIIKRNVSSLSRTWLIQRCQSLLDDGYKGRSARTYQTNVCMLVNWVVDNGGLPRSPMRKLPRLPIDRTLHFLEDADVMRLERCCAGYPDVKMACVAMLCLHAGLRRTEALTLEWRELVFDGPEPVVTVLASHAKSKKPRRIGINSTLLNFLVERRSKLADKRPFFFEGVDHKFGKLRRAAGLSIPCTLHGLRHTFATQLVSRGIHINDVQALLGHADLVTTGVYVHAMEKGILRATRVLDQPRLKPLLQS